MDSESREMFKLILSRFEEIDKRFDKMDKRFDKMDNRFDKMENRLNVIEHKADRTAKKLDDLRIDVAVAERDIRREIFELKDKMETVIEVLKINELLPQ